MIGNLLRSIWWIIVLAIVCLIAIIILLKKLSKRNQIKKEQRLQASDRARDESLNDMILNSRVKDKQNPVYVPYDVDYSKSVDKHEKKPSKTDVGVMVQIIENTELSERKFVLNVSRGIKIGTAIKGNDISFICEDTPYQCEIFEVNGDICARNLIEASRVIVHRKKQYAVIDPKGLKLLSGDTIQMGKYSYTIVRV